MHLKRNMCRHLQDNQITMGFVAFLGSSPNSSSWFIVTFCTGRWEGNVFYLTTHSTHFNLLLYGVGHMVKNHSDSEREREMFYLTKHSTQFIYSYMASDIWLRTILIVRKETHCRHIGYSYRLTARVLLYAPSHRQDNTYHSLCYTSRGALAGTRNSSMGPPHEGSIRRPTAP